MSLTADPGATMTFVAGGALKPIVCAIQEPFGFGADSILGGAHLGTCFRDSDVPAQRYAATFSFGYSPQWCK